MLPSVKSTIFSGGDILPFANSVSWPLFDILGCFGNVGVKIVRLANYIFCFHFEPVPDSGVPLALAFCRRLDSPVPPLWEIEDARRTFEPSHIGVSDCGVLTVHLKHHVCHAFSGKYERKISCLVEKRVIPVGGASPGKAVEYTDTDPYYLYVLWPYHAYIRVKVCTCFN
jgi:hypothetical protein